MDVDGADPIISAPIQIIIGKIESDGSGIPINIGGGEEARMEIPAQFILL